MTEQEPSCHHCGLPVPAGRRGPARPWFCCFGCRFAHELAVPASDSQAAASPAAGTLLLRLGLGIFLALNIMVASWLSYSREIYGAAAQAAGSDAILPAVFSYLALFLCTLLMAILGLPLLTDTLRTPRISAQTLIVLGVFAAYGLSAVHTLRGKGSLYYDTAAMVLVIVTLGSYLEAGAKRRAADAASDLLAALPSAVRVRRDATIYELPVEEVHPGDRIQVRPGEVLPVDGKVVSGTSRIDEASLTGESRPRAVESGDSVLAGVVSLDGQLWLDAEKVGDDTVLALMERSLETARAQRPEAQRLADRIAAVFVPIVVVTAVAVFGFRAWQGQAVTGLLDGLAVLLISCPCALGLAAPLACWHGLRRAARRGILVDGAPTLERAATVDRLYFDKTGTLTRPELALEQIVTAPDITPRQALSWAAGLESSSTHPIARGLLRLAESRDIEPPAPEAASAVPGLGVEGSFDGRTFRLGSARWLKHYGLENQRLAQEAPDAASCVFLIDEEQLLARFELAEQLRPGATPTVSELQDMGIEVGILSGDRSRPTRRIAKQLGISAESDLLPDEKVRQLTESRRAGARAAMVGDGLNDAPVLAAADVGVALGSASDLARSSGNVRLTNDRLERVPELLHIARDVRRRIRTNLIWAFSFNSVGIALAAAGLLTPVFAAAAMVLSSLTVVRISSRAGRLNGEPDNDRPGESPAEVPTPALGGSAARAG